jgi:threonylcarbamoyladenosine tRNA methylthiotransferase MtaB
LPNVTQVVVNSGKDEIVDRISANAGPTTADRFAHGDGACGDTLGPGVMGRTALTLRVQTGCEERCSYCIIPRTRGRGVSRPISLVLRDVQRALAAGYKEIVITGVHLGSYGRDLGDGSSLSALIRALGDSSSDAIFRVSSLEPMDCTPEIVDCVRTSPRLAPHFHLPLQHGCDAVLRAMRRPYTVAYYRSLVERIRTAMPDASIGSDIIVGFPGETGAQFVEMEALLERLPLTYLHVFPYSDRPGTAAANLQPKVDGVAIRQRAREIRAIGERMAHNFRQSQVGKTRRALTVDDGSTAVTENYLKVRLTDLRQRNEWVRIRIDNAEPAVIGTVLPH